MSRRFFSSDFHLGSTNILKYASRPWKSAQESVDAIVKSGNETCSKSDVLIHVGDFILSGKDSHDTEVDVGLAIKQEDYLKMFDTNVFLLNGNHDSTHNAEAYADNMWLDLNQNYRHIFCSHFPSYHDFYRGPAYKDKISIVLCGHVHDKFLFMFDHKKNVLNINVGIDVWQYSPVEDVQLTELLDYLKAYLWNKFLIKEDFKMDRKHFEMFKTAKTVEVKEARIQRKVEKHAKKGLTPEECERRKQAAMKAKGLI